MVETRDISCMSTTKIRSHMSYNTIQSHSFQKTLCWEIYHWKKRADSDAAPQRYPAAFEIQVLSTSIIKCRGDFRIFQFASEIRRQKYCQRLSRNLCILRPKWLRYTSNEWNGRQYFSYRSSCFGFFVCPSYSRRTHYPTLEKPGVQNIAACINQGKQRKLSDH